MKKAIAVITLLVATLAFAQETQGIKANVELLSGTKQRAQFLGIQNDTVQLGGYIKNQFTIVRFHKDKFKSIVDEQGNDLLHPATTTDSLTQSAPADTVTQAAMDTTGTSPIADSADTASTAEKTSEVATDSSVAPENIVKVRQGSVLVSFESTSDDTLMSQQITALAARLLLESGEELQVVKRYEFADCDDDACIQNKLSTDGFKTIYFGKTGLGTSPDSISLELTKFLYQDELPEVYKSSINVAKKATLTSILEGDKLKTLLMQPILKVESKVIQKNSYIFVETDPDGATISRPEKDAICRTPCTFAISDTSKFQFYAYWNVGTQLWGASSTVRPIPGDTAKISIKLKPVTPEVHVITTPADAEVFAGSGEITKRSDVLISTPGKFILSEPGMANITLRHVGYKDTTVKFYVAPVSETKLDIEMERLTNYDDIVKQQEWNHDRTMLHLGHALMATSVAPLIVGAIFTYLASQDYDDADAIKKELNMPGSTHGENFQAKIKKNKKLVDEGDKKMIIGASLAGTSVLLFGIGLFFTF